MDMLSVQLNVSSQSQSSKPRAESCDYQIILMQNHQYNNQSVRLIKSQQQMSLQIRTKQNRLLSAKVTTTATEKRRPQSGVPQQAYTRKEMIETVYTSLTTQPRLNSARQSSNNIMSYKLDTQRPFRKASRQNGEKEQMSVEIMNLKQTINRLVEELSHQKGKMQNISKKNEKYSKILSTEFENERHWSSTTVSNHLVTGIRSMYDNLKQKYEIKCRQYDCIFTQSTTTKDMEDKVYIELLEKELKLLSKKVQNPITNYIQKEAKEYVMHDLQAHNTTLIERNKQLQQRLNKQKTIYKQNTRKIEFMEKLVIEKDNCIHATQRKIKEVNRQIAKSRNANEKLTIQNANLKEEVLRESNAYKANIAAVQSEHKQGIQAILQEKDRRIANLEDNNHYLLKLTQQLRQTNAELNRINMDYQQHKSIQQKNFTKSVQFNKVSQKGQRKSPEIISLESRNGTIKKADRKHSQNAIKTRKVQLAQVLEIAEFIRLKLIAQKISLEQMKQLFNQPNQNNTKNGYDSITMKQAKEVLLKYPFNLQQEQSYLLARYLIQDVQQDYVYCDEINENHREVVKSIIRTLIQQYPIYSLEAPQEKQLTAALQSYGQSLKSIFKSMNRLGVLSKQKIKQVVKSIGMDISEESLELLFAKIAIKSKRLSELNSLTIF